MLSSSVNRRGRGSFTNAKKTSANQSSAIAFGQLLKQARKSGQLNLSGRSLTNVDDSVWKINIELPEESKVATLDGGDDVWWEQALLTKLILASNWLTEIPADIRLLESLTVLDAHDNRLDTISDAIGDLVNLQKLLLSHNKLSTLPASLAKLSSLVTLHLDNNQISQLDFDIGKLTNLTDFNLSKNKLTCLPPAVDWLKQLTNLNVSQNNLTELPVEIGSLSCLQTLDAQQNKITTIPDSLGDLRKLELLYLQQNKLTSVPLLTHCQAIKEVQLGNNCLTDIPSDHLVTYSTVSILDLRDNKISELPEEIGLLQSLERLCLSNNNLTSLPNVVGTLTNLKSLQLEGNSLRSIRRDIIMRGTNELKKYLRSRMSESEIHEQVEKQSQSSLPTSTQQSTSNLNTHEVHQLKTLDYSNKQAASIPGEVWSEISKANITSVNLNKNKLTDLPPGLMVTSDTLKDLQMAFNQIVSLPPDIGLYLHLVTLDLRRNSLSSLPDEASSLTNLRDIILSCNRFEQLPKVLYKLMKLEVIIASDNKITSIDIDGLFNLKKLATLDLQNNNIAVVPAELGKMTWLRHVQLSGNAFRNPRPAILCKGTDALLTYLRDKIA